MTRHIGARGFPARGTGTLLDMEDAPAGPVIPADPFHGATVPPPRTLLPSDLAAAAVASTPRGREDAADADAALGTWYNAFAAVWRGASVEGGRIEPAVRQSVFERLLAAYHPGEVVVPVEERGAFQVLARLGVVTLTGDVAELTPLGVWGLFRYCGWTDETPWVLEAGDWRPGLTTADVRAWLLALTERRLHQRRSWLETADPAVLAGQLVEVMLEADGEVRTAAFAFLLRLGAPAAPAVLRLADTELIGWAYLWGQNNGLRLPRELTPAELAEVKGELVPALAMLQARFLDASGDSGTPGDGTTLEGDSQQAMLLSRLYGIGEPLSDAERERLARLLGDRAFLAAREAPDPPA